jgi:hypothetical protein
MPPLETETGDAQGQGLSKWHAGAAVPEVASFILPLLSLHPK